MSTEEGATFLSKLNDLIMGTPEEVILKAQENVHIRKRRAEENDEDTLLWIALEGVVLLCHQLKVM